MDDLAKLARRMGGWEKLARVLYKGLLPHQTGLAMRRTAARKQIEMGKIFEGVKRGRPTKHDFSWVCQVLDALEQSKMEKPHESTTYHWQKVARKLNPGLSPKKEDATIKTLMNIVSEHKARIRQVEKFFPEGNIPPTD